MIFQNMNNFSIQVNGNTFWISRSIAVLGIITGFDKDGIQYVLATQRGKGTPDPAFVGCWCLPRGYLDYDETLKEAISREVLEETGLKIDKSLFSLLSINSNPEEKRQNVTIRFGRKLSSPIEDYELSTEFSEPDEIEAVKWIPIYEYFKYKWAFNHDKLIKEYVLDSRH